VQQLCKNGSGGLCAAVGAGGIGQTLYESIRNFPYADTAAQIIVVW
jgi:ABC-type phosphate/phosphonate transport system permease subunit